MMYDKTDSLDPKSFCHKWIPRLTGIQPNQRGYRKLSCQLLSLVLGKSEGTVQNWLLPKSSKGYRQPEKIVGRYLKTLDLFWEVEIQSPFSFSQAKNYLQQKLSD